MGNASSAGHALIVHTAADEERPSALQMLTNPDIVPRILDYLDWPSKGWAACVCRQWRLLAGSAEASLSAGRCWLTWQQAWPPEGPVLRHVQECKLRSARTGSTLPTSVWPQLPALTAVHIEARMTTTRGLDDPVHWNNKTVRDLSVTVLRTKEHCLAHGVDNKHRILSLGVASSCLETLCVRAVAAETGLLAHDGWGSGRSNIPVGVYVDLQLTSVPELHQLLVCCDWFRVSSGHKVASADWDRPAVRFSGLRAAIFVRLE